MSNPIFNAPGAPKSISTMLVAGLAFATMAMSFWVGQITTPAADPVYFGFVYALSFIPLYFLYLHLQKWQFNKPGKNLLILIPVVSIFCHLAYSSQAISDDVYRYAWEGEIQLHGHNPYITAPDSKQLDDIRNENSENLNHPTWTTIYGPFAQMIFATTARFDPHIQTFRYLSIISNLITVILLMFLFGQSGHSPLWASLYAWNPLVLWQLAGAAHLDSLMLLLVTASFLANYRKHHILAMMLIGCAVCVKFTALLFVPCLLIACPRRYFIAFILAAVALYWPYADAGWNLFDSLVRFGTESHYNGALFKIFSFGLGNTIALYISLACMTVLTSYWMIKKGDPIRMALWLTTGFILLAPTVHSWYLLWALPWACVWWQREYLLLAACMIFTLEAQAFHMANQGLWREVAWVSWAVYTPFILLWVGLYLKCKFGSSCKIDYITKKNKP